MAAAIMLNTNRPRMEDRRWKMAPEYFTILDHLSFILDPILTHIDFQRNF